jgi:hypothetical protein
MIIFNTIKKAKHYVKFCNKNHDYYHNGYDWGEHRTYIDGDLVKVINAGDGCGCGCDLHIYNCITIIGRIKAHDTKTIRSNKLNNLGIQ